MGQCISFHYHQPPEAEDPKGPQPGTSLKEDEDGSKSQGAEEPPEQDPLYQHYVVDERVLGRGQFGVVRRATHKVTGGRYAVKFINKARIRRPEVLKTEMEVLLQVNHPNICNVVDIFDSADDAELHIVMDYYSGQELFDRIVNKYSKAGSRFTEAEVARLVQQMLVALEYCHDVVGICHRDLKPENILFKSSQEDSDLVLIDFGLSTMIANPSDETPYQEDHMRSRVGTPFYMAPEIFTRDYDRSCDLWSIGIITYVMMCGYLPFNGSDETSILEAVRNPEVRVVFHSQYWKHVSPAAKRFINKLLNRNPRLRPTAHEALKDEWFTATKVEAASFSDTIGPRLAKYQRMNQFKRMASLVIASRIVDAQGRYDIRTASAAEASLSEVRDSEELVDLERQFKEVDVNHDGTISVDELRAALDAGLPKKRAWFHLTRNISRNRVPDQDSSKWAVDVDQVFDDIDLDRQQEINYTEFLAATLSRRLRLQPDLLRDAFNYFDTDQSGVITSANLAELLQDQEDANFLMRGAGYDPKTPITMAMFCDMMRAPDYKSTMASAEEKNAIPTEEDMLTAVACHWVDTPSLARSSKAIDLARGDLTKIGFRLIEINVGTRVLIVRDVDAQGIGAACGLKEFDVLLELEGKEIEGLDLAAIKSGVRMSIIKRGHCNIVVASIDPTQLRNILKQPRPRSVSRPDGRRMSFSIQAQI